MVEPEILARFARSSGRTPSRRSAIELVAPDVPFVSRTAELLEDAVEQTVAALVSPCVGPAAGHARSGR